MQNSTTRERHCNECHVCVLQVADLRLVCLIHDTTLFVMVVGGLNVTHFSGGYRRARSDRHSSVGGGPLWCRYGVSDSDSPCLGA